MVLDEFTARSARHPRPHDVALPAPAAEVALTSPAGDVERLADQFDELLALPGTALEHAMAERIRREHDLDDDARHRVTLDRLRAWLRLDPEDARILARTFDRAAASLGPEVEARRIETERAVVLNGMRFAEFRRLVPLLGWLAAEPAPGVEELELATAAA